MCSCLLPAAAINTTTESNLRRKHYFLLNFQVRQELEAGMEAEPTEECRLLVCSQVSRYFSSASQARLPQYAHSVPVPPTSISNQESTP